jgi:hypothetical protein
LVASGVGVPPWRRPCRVDNPINRLLILVDDLFRLPLFFLSHWREPSKGGGDSRGSAPWRPI